MAGARYRHETAAIRPHRCRRGVRAAPTAGPPWSGEQLSVAREGGEDGVDVGLVVVRVRRDAQVRVTLRSDDSVGCEGGDEGRCVRGTDADEGAAALLVARGDG